MNQLTVIFGLAIALCASLGVNLNQWRDCAVDAAAQVGKVNTEAAQAETVAHVEARDVEADNAARAAAISAAYEKGKEDAEVAGKRAVSDLNNKFRRLRERWENPTARTCDLSAANAAAGEPDGQAQARRESVGRIIRTATEYEQQIIGLQGYILDQCAPKPSEANGKP